MIDNIVDVMQTVPWEIQERQLRYVYKADPADGEGAAKGLWLAFQQDTAA